MKITTPMTLIIINALYGPILKRCFLPFLDRIFFFNFIKNAISICSCDWLNLFPWRRLFDASIIVYCFHFQCFLGKGHYFSISDRKAVGVIQLGL